MKFKYFESPGKFACFVEGKTTCDICTLEKKCLDAGLFVGEDSINTICLDCLAAGELNEMDIYTCQCDTEELRKQLQSIHPSMSEAEIESVVNQKTQELEKTTPPVITWQDWDWPCADGDYCMFLSYGSKALYNKLAEDKDGQSLFIDSVYHNLDDADTDELWEDSMPAKLIKDNRDADGLSPLFYVFKSVSGDKIVTLWDMD